MKAFAYVNAANQKEAVAALGPERGKFLPLAGGMDLLALMKDHILEPERVVNVKNLDRTIRKSADGGQSFNFLSLSDDLPAVSAGRRFRSLIERKSILRIPGAHNGMASLQAKAAGFRYHLGALGFGELCIQPRQAHGHAGEHLGLHVA